MSDDSEDSPPRPKRKIKRVTILSSSESESDDSVTAVGTRRNRMRVVSDDESDSSGSEVVRTRRGRALPKLRDSDSEGAACLADAVPRPTSGFASDSSEGNSEKCSICLMRFTDQEVGTPQSCEHIFCLDCITEWSKNVNTCPVDRLTFDSIVVRACAGGRVLRTEQVKVIERRPSVDVLVVEDPTVCEVCGRSGDEESMLLCDGCDLGYHMQCLSPPLTEVPIDQWYCPSCNDLIDVVHTSEVDDLLSDVFVDMYMPIGPRPSPLRQPRNVRRSSRQRSTIEGPSISSDTQGNVLNSNVIPSTSRGSLSIQSSSSRGSRTRRVTTSRPTRRRKYRRQKTVIIEYEEAENGKVAIKTVQKKVARKKIRKRKTRTAARRALVRESVRVRLAALRPPSLPLAPTRLARTLPRPALRLFGDPLELDYFSDEAPGDSESASTAVAARSTSALLSAHRQARRKAVGIPSPPVAASAPDLLSSIMESQTLLHAKNSIMSVTGDGKLEIKLRSPIARPREQRSDPTTNGRVDLTKGEDSAKKAPSYPGQHRSGGWGGGYRGNYHREQGHTGFGRASYGGAGYAGGGQQAQNQNSNFDDRQGSAYRPMDAWRDEPPLHGDYGRWPPRHPLAHDVPSDRNRRNSDRGPPPRAPPPWRPYVPPHPSRHSFGGFDNPLDMRTAPHHYDRPTVAARPLPEPPIFKFDDNNEVERSEDERSDPDLVIDTDKYDPTEPTNDDSAEEPELPPEGPHVDVKSANSNFQSIDESVAESETEAEAEGETHGVGAGAAGMEAAAVPAALLDDAVRQVLAEHRGLLAAPPPLSDEEDDGDCPNFSIYSATSVHIANDAAAGVLPAENPAPRPSDDLRDLVQEDDDLSPPPPLDAVPKKKSDEIYNEKVSKRCPITTDTRSPIKIKINAPSLIKKRVSLYDEEEDSMPAESGAPPEDESSPSKSVEPNVETDKKSVETVTQKNSSEDNKDNAVSQMASSDLHNSDLNSHELDSAKQVTEADAFPEASCEPAADGGENVKDNRTIPSSDVLETAHKSDHTEQSDSETSEPGDRERPASVSPRGEEPLEKMTESISETEDERSYTPCLDENKSKDTSLETEKDKGLEGLDTEMISEDEGNEMFSEEDKPKSVGAPCPSPERPPERLRSPPLDSKKDAKDSEGKGRKKKKDIKKDAKERVKTKKKTDVEFKKLSKNGKERNYRERDKNGTRDRRESTDSAEREKRKRKRKEKRKDLERYDVRNIVSEKRKKRKDQFGRDVSPRVRSPSLSPPPRRSPSRARRSPSRLRRTPSPGRASPPRRLTSLSPVGRRKRSNSRRRRSPTPRIRRSPSPVRPSLSPVRIRRSLSPHRPATPRALSPSPRRRRRTSTSRGKRNEPRRRRSTERARKRRRSVSGSRSPRPKSTKRKKRARSERPASKRRSPRKKSPKRRRIRNRSASRVPAPSPTRGSPSPAPPAVSGAPVAPAQWTSPSRLASPRTPPAAPRRRRDPARHRRHARDPGGASKEVFTSGDNILVSVSFKDQDRVVDDDKRERRRERRRRKRKTAAPEPEVGVRPVAIIDLERSPFRELTPSPRDVIVLSDSDPGEREPAPAPEVAAPEPVGPKTPPEPTTAEPAPAADPEDGRGPNTPPEPPDSPDAYDPYEPTRSASASPSPAPSPAPALSPPRPTITLEAAQKTNMSADEVLDRRPLSPMEKVMALLQSTRDVSPEPPPCDPLPTAEVTPGPPPAAAPQVPAAAPPRIVLPEATRTQPPKLFLAKPSPIKSDPIKPMPAAKIARVPLGSGGGGAPAVSLPGEDSPYSPGSSDFGELFEPPRRDMFEALLDRPRHKSRSNAAKVPVKLDRHKGKTQVGVKIDEDSLKILDELPSSAVEMQVKSKFLKKLNRQERVVEEVKLVLKPHYNRKRITKEEYKDVLRRAVPKICHNRTGEINPTKIQALIEAYVRKIRKKHKLGLA